ncbi:putative transcription factor GRAS family [Dioscorea sansibarensis]
MASGYPGREYLLKRTLPEQQQQQQQSQQLQQALFLRSVKHKAVPLQTSPISPLDLSHASSTLVGFSFPPVGVMEESEPELEPEPESEKKTVIIKNRLQELERQLLLDDDEDEESAVTNNEWNDTIQQLISPLSPSPTSSSSSSTASSAASSSSSSRQLLLDTANAISDGNLDTAAANLTQLKQAANPRGDADQRLTAIMVSALMSRLNPSPSASHPFADLGCTEHLAGTAMLHEVSPVFKFGLVAANLAILDATRDHLKIHIIDFDVGQGVQYVAFIHALADHHRHNPSSRLPAVKITAVADPSLPFHASHLKNNNNNNLRRVGEGLARLAERAGVGLRFNIVCRRPSELDRSTLGCEPGEALAVNFAFLLSRVADESVTPANPRDELLRRVKALSPLIAILVEQDMNTNTAPFAPRFAEVCAHHGALLDSLHANPALDLAKRALVEACIARKATNAVARDGVDRVERCEVFGKWRARMGMAGFTPSPLTASVTDPVHARLGSLRPNPGFTLKEDVGGLCLGWHGRVLTVASAWR